MRFASRPLAGKDAWVDLPWLSCPNSPVSMVLSHAAGVWMDQDVKVISVLLCPGGSSLIILLRNEP